MKTTKIQSLKGFILTMVLMVSSVIAGYAAAHVTLSSDNCIVSNNVIQFRVIITNDGDQAVALNSSAIRIGLNAALLSGSPTIKCSYVGESDFPLIFEGVNGGGKYTASYINASNSMNLTNSTKYYTAQNAVTIPVGGSKVLGTVSFTNTTGNWVANTPIGLTWMNNAGVVAYVGGATTTVSMRGASYLGELCSQNTPLTTGVFNISDPESGIITAYPNPTSGLVDVVFSSKTASNSVIKVVDMTGRVVMNQVKAAQEGTNTIKLDLTNYAKGIYNISITTDMGSKQVRLTLE